MNGAFIYNKYVTGKHHIGRERGHDSLNLLSQGENVLIYEPRKRVKRPHP